MNFEPLSKKEEDIAKKIVDSAYLVHKALGQGILEKVYEACFCYKLNKKGLLYKRQADVPIVYDGLTFEEGFRLDVLIEDLVICELKAVDNMHPVWEAQILSYLKLSGKRLGFLINFNERYVKDGIKRIIL
ncbi:conserved hypothetical protein [Candidatus Brocadia pituitae]|nr:conserved hypothetical protein [Candidatus Brocadia pituitae]